MVSSLNASVSTPPEGRVSRCVRPTRQALLLACVMTAMGVMPMHAAGGQTAKGDLLPSGHAIFAGQVLNDTTRTPIANADVALQGIARSQRTNERGEFRFIDVPAGTYDLTVRRLGYGVLDARIELAAGQAVTRLLLLTQAPMLDSVLVLADRRHLQEFDENRALGLGHFFTREDLAKVEGVSLSSILAGVPGIKFQYYGNHAYLEGSRGIKSQHESHCYAQVYLDGMLVYRKQGDDRFDLNSISPATIEAIEYYAGPASTPTRYNNLDSRCGVVVIWTRRAR